MQDLQEDRNSQEMLLGTFASRVCFYVSMYSVFCDAPVDEKFSSYEALFSLPTSTVDCRPLFEPGIRLLLHLENTKNQKIQKIISVNC